MDGNRPAHETDVQHLQQQLDFALQMIHAIDQGTARIEFEPDGTILYANDLFCAAMGYTREQIVGQHHRVFMFPGDAATDTYRTHWQRLAHGEILSGEFRRKTASGDEVFI